VLFFQLGEAAAGIAPGLADVIDILREVGFHGEIYGVAHEIDITVHAGISNHDEVKLASRHCPFTPEKEAASLSPVARD